MNLYQIVAPEKAQKQFLAGSTEQNPEASNAQCLTLLGIEKNLEHGKSAKT